MVPSISAPVCAWTAAELRDLCLLHMRSGPISVSQRILQFTENTRAACNPTETPLFPTWTHQNIQTIATQILIWDVQILWWRNLSATLVIWLKSKQRRWKWHMWIHVWLPPQKSFYHVTVGCVQIDAHTLSLKFSIQGLAFYLVLCQFLQWDKF